MLIDSHVHVGEWKYFDSFGKAYSGFQDILLLLKAKGYAGAVFMPSELKSNRDLLEEIRKYKEAENSFRCWFFPWLNPHRQDDLRFAEDHIREIDGLKFHPSLDRIRFTEKSHHAFLDMAAAHHIPILVHCGAWIEMAHYRFVLDVAEAYPGVNFILAHQGGTTYELKTGAAAEVKEKSLENVYFDIAGTHEYWLLEHCVEELGPERFLLGSDFPIRDVSLSHTVIDGCRISAADKELIKGTNFSRLMNFGKDASKTLQ